MSIAMQPYNQGYRAFLNGLDVIDNPYSFGSVEHDEWKNGWKEAEDDDDSSVSNYYSGDLDDEFDELFGESRYDDDD